MRASDGFQQQYYFQSAMKYLVSHRNRQVFLLSGTFMAAFFLLDGSHRARLRKLHMGACLLPQVKKLVEQRQPRKHAPSSAATALAIAQLADGVQCMDP